jgi:hypothetical protein
MGMQLEGLLWDLDTLKINTQWPATFKAVVNGPKQFKPQVLNVLDLLASEGMVGARRVMYSFRTRWPPGDM